MRNYSFDIRWSERDGEYIALCPSFPGLSAFGSTPKEALAEARIALELFIEEYQESKIELPPPIEAGTEHSCNGWSGAGI